MTDAHIHHEFQSVTPEGAQRELDHLERCLVERGIDKAVLYMIYDGDISLERYKLDFGERIIPSCMLDPRGSEDTLDKQLASLRESGVKMLKLLPYEQRLLRGDYPAVADYALLAQKYDMAITMCASYGSTNLYNTNGVELAAYILECGFTNPLIIAHGGMVKVLDTYSLMDVYENLYMDISFTLPFWKGSTVIQDYAFVLKKLSFERTFYGSDYPYVTMEEALEVFDWFCDTYNVDSAARDMLLRANFEKFEQRFLRTER